MKKCTSRLEGNYKDPNRTNLNCVSNNKHYKYHCVVLSSFGQTNQLTASLQGPIIVTLHRENEEANILARARSNYVHHSLCKLHEHGKSDPIVVTLQSVPSCYHSFYCLTLRNSSVEVKFVWQVSSPTPANGASMEVYFGLKLITDRQKDKLFDTKYMGV